ncbi:MAG TPA: M48 family metalloprotease [Nitrospiria bacterium]|nr:M48 family metalloprotease [Nitrospiria bacterium]
MILVRHVTTTRLMMIGLALLAGCLPMALTPIELDKELGKQTAKQVDQQIGLYEAPVTGEYLGAIGARLVDHLEERQFQYVFNIVDQQDPNAFAAPGGYVYFSRGLLSLANSEDELAGVMGHEIIHVHERHSVRQSRKGILPRLLTLPGRIVGGVVSENLGALINAPVNLMGTVYLATYSRGQESQADELGIKLAAASGYDPKALAAMLLQLEEAQKEQTGKAQTFSFFASHPMTPSRIKVIDREAADLHWKRAPPIADGRRAFLSHLNGLVLEDDPAQGLFKGRQYVQPDLNFTITFPDKWKTVNTPSAVGAFAEKQDGLAVIGLAGKDADPDLVAQTFISDMKHKQKVEPTEVKDVQFGDWHGKLVTYTDKTGKEPMTLYFLWVRMGAMTYQLIGLGPERYHELLRETAMSLRPLTAEERSSVTVKRLRIAEARAGESLEELVRRVDNSWTPAYTAVANEIPADKPLEAGQLIKFSHEEPYRSKADGQE